MSLDAVVHLYIQLPKENHPCAVWNLLIFFGRTLEGKLQQHAVSHATGVALEEGWMKRKKEG